MKHTLTLLFLSLSVGFISAQTTITNTSFFQMNDILYTSNDDIPNVDLGTTGGNQTWDYSSLSSTQVDATEVFPATSGMGGAAFPQADVYINFLGGELYLQINTNEIKQIGFVGAMAGFDVNTAFNPQGNFRRAPINYQDSFTDENGIAFTIAAEDIPFLDSLELPVNPDSIRVTQIFTTEYEADAWGTMTIPMGTFDVLRMRRLQTTTTQIEAFVPFLNWIDVTDLLGGLGGGGIPGGFGDGAVESYEFLADGVKEAIATVQLDTVGGDIVRVTYKAQETGTPIAEVGDDSNLFAAHPNPAYGDVRIDIRGFDNGNYELNLYNIAGKRVLTQNVEVNRDTAVIINVANLDKGTYLYALHDSAGKVIRARRLMVIKP